MPTTLQARSEPGKKEIRESAPPREPVLLHEFFEAAARRWPTAPAVDVPPSSTRATRHVLSYGEIKRQSDALANLLREFVREECVVAILLPRESEHLYIAQLAVLKAGAAYACLDPLFPDEQLLAVLEDSDAVAVLTDRAGSQRVRRVKPDVDFALDVVAWGHAMTGPVEPTPPAPWLTPRSLAYLIYTSGTTGRPKGVMIEHASIANLVRGNLPEFSIRPGDRIAQGSSCAYDVSVEEVWLAFSAGATLVVMDDETVRLGPDLVSWLQREQITVLSPTPTLLRSTGCENPGRELPNIRLVYVGGEALPPDVAERWASGRCLMNGYGPTETTVTSLRGAIETGQEITIGRPVPEVDAWILNDRLEEVAEGEQGELCLGGIALARGYRNSPDLTARKFPLHPRFGRIYRTGDLVHRDRDGNFFFHGRIDTQVKVRGYRIELEAIETRLVECDGVREAACRVQGEGTHQAIVAFIVPETAGAPPGFELLKENLRRVLPEYMVPTNFGVLSHLPTSLSGKLNRRALPALEVKVQEIRRGVMPRNDLETSLAAAMQAVFKLREPISVTDDFFNDLGGDSLLAAQLISRLRDHPATAALAVRDVYDARTIAELAKRIPNRPAQTSNRRQPRNRSGERPVLATLVQTAWLLLGLLVGAPVAYGLAFHLLPYLTDTVGMVTLALVTPIVLALGYSAYTLATVAFAVVLKKILIGRYQPTRAPIWGGFYIRNWLVQQAVRLIPWRALEGTVFQLTVLRALGARIGQRVHVHRGVNLWQGGWDLLEIGDNVTLSQDATVGIVEFEQGEIVIGPVTLGSGCTLDIRAGVASHTVMEPDSYLAPLSFLQRGGRVPYGESWDGIPAQLVGKTHVKPNTTTGQRELSPGVHGLALGVGRGAVALWAALPTLLLTFLLSTFTELDVENAIHWLFDSSVEFTGFLLAILIVLLHVPMTLVFEAIGMRLMGRVPEGVISRWSLEYVRVWLKSGLVDSANSWLTGSLYWPIWLRLAGMKIGRGTEMSTVIDTVPELVEVGAGSFFADGIYLGGPRIHRGTVTLARVQMGNEIFLGNNVVILAGQTIPDRVLLGISTVADDAKIRPGTSWFGQPAFELPKREIVECDRALTHTPLWVRYLRRLFWDTLRFALPLAPLMIVVVWFRLLALAEDSVSLPVLVLGVVPLLDLGVLASLCLFGLALKWALLGRVKPGIHPLYSSWCSRWEFHYIAWDLYTAGPLSALEGTLLINWFFRAMGMKVGRGVYLGAGVVHQVDHDMLEFEDGATLTCMFQAHTFEDRVLKIDRIKIHKEATVGQMAVVLYGADVGESTYVAPHSVVMKHEKLLPNENYTGAPTHLV